MVCPAMTKESTAIYLRVSTDEQRERQTIETQRRETARYCELRQMNIQGVYEDDGVSGTVPFSDRPQGSALWRDIAAGNVESVLVFRIDRIARRVIHTLNFVEHAERHKTKIISVSEQIDLTSAMGRLMLQIAAVFAENERAVMRERSMAGRRRRAAAGKISTPAPYGYVIKDGDMMIDEEKAETVAQIFRWYASGTGMKEIVRRLVAVGTPSPRGSRWLHSTLIYILKQTHYYGDFTHYRTPLRDPLTGKKTVRRDFSERMITSCPAIIDRALYDEVQRQIERNTNTGPASSKRTYLLRGLIRCATCGMTYVGHSISGRKHTDKEGNVKHYPDFIYYECASLTNQDYKYCGSPRVNARDLETHVWSEIEGFLRNPSEVIEKLLELHRKRAAGTFDTERRLASINQKIEKNAAQRKRIVHAIGQGTITHEDAADELKTISTARNTLLLERMSVEAVAGNDENLKRQLNSTREMLLRMAERLDEGLTGQDKAQLLNRMIDVITIKNVEDDGGKKRPHAVVNYLFQKGNEEDCFASDESSFNASSLKK